MINAKLKDAIAGGAHSIHVHPAVSSERSSGQGNQGDAANRPSVKFPDFSFPAVEFHDSSLFHRKSIESKPAEFMVSRRAIIRVDLRCPRSRKAAAQYREQKQRRDRPEIGRQQQRDSSSTSDRGYS